MKRIKMSVIVLLVGMLSVAAVSAEGIQERSEGAPRAWNAPAQGSVQSQSPAQTRWQAPDEQAQGWGRPGRGAAPNAAHLSPYAGGESLSLEGTVSLSAAGVSLTTEDGETYELLYPRFLAEGMEVNNGESISVEGFEVPGPRWTAASEDQEDRKYLRITAAEIDGEEYEVAGGYGSYGHGAYGPGMTASRGGGRTGGYGPGMRGGAYDRGMRGGGQSMRGGGSGYRW